MVIMRRIEINGESPFQYSNEHFDKLNRKVYANEYTLITGDSFEMGGAYSLHRTEDEAKRYFARDWWHKVRKAIPVFVSDTTLEAIAKREDKCIFKSWEN